MASAHSSDGRSGRLNLDVCCDVVQATTPLTRRSFLRRAGVAAGTATLIPAVPRIARCEAAVAAARPASESLVKTLYESLSPGQREKICFAWDHRDEQRGLLRTRVGANWDITEHFVNEDFYTGDQRQMIREIFEGLYQPEWIAKIDRQLDDDAGGFGEQNSIAIFGEPGGDRFEFVMTGRHMTIRCDGDTSEHVAFGGPIFYGHAADGFDEGPTHPGNVFWPQAVEANRLYEALDGKQQKLALVKQGTPGESRVGFRGPGGEFQGIPLTELSGDQRERVQEVLQKLIEPFRQSDRDETLACLKKQGGLDACSLAFYAENDIGDDGVWDNWRLEGPSFVWHFRGSPHVHVWVNVADDPSPKLNA
ncbi:MAG: DUF3500 domain-containing protein [Planctomycetales bacterium]|nr:DUF3500 domain-containing protein [Planctomycetales bacterium]